MTKNDFPVVYRIGIIHCKQCKSGFAPAIPVFARKIKEVLELGKQAHFEFCATNRIICSNPALIVEYANAVVDRELYARWTQEGKKLKNPTKAASACPKCAAVLIAIEADDGLGFAVHCSNNTQCNFHSKWFATEAELFANYNPLV